MKNLLLTLLAALFSGSIALAQGNTSIYLTILHPEMLTSVQQNGSTLTPVFTNLDINAVVSICSFIIIKK